MPSYGLAVVAGSMHGRAEITLIDRSLAVPFGADGYGVELDISHQAISDAHNASRGGFDVVAIQVHTGNLLASATFLEELRESGGNAKVIVGGPSANIVFRLFSKRRLADQFYFGDASTALEHLGTEDRAPTNMLLAGCEAITAPYLKATGQWRTPDFKALYGRAFSVVPFLSTVGCPYNCSFCSSRKDQLGFSLLKNIEDDLGRLIDAHRPKLIRFNDSTLNGHRATFEGILSLLEQYQPRIRWGAYISLSGLRVGDVCRMADAGCAYAYIGIESGVSDIRAGQKKMFSDLHAVRIAKEMRECNIAVLASFIVGLPGEDVESIERTEELLLSIYPAAAHVFAFEERCGLSELPEEHEYWRALLSRTNHRTLAPQHSNPLMSWHQTLESVEQLKASLARNGILDSESALVRLLVTDKPKLEQN